MQHLLVVKGISNENPEEDNRLVPKLPFIQNAKIAVKFEDSCLNIF